MSSLVEFLGMAPDGRELYRYRLPRARYIRLQSHLHETLNGTLRQANREACALFCLFAAEWWRREHERGPWSWDGIKEAVGVGATQYPTLAAKVDLGLAVLKRPILKAKDGANARLITLACEGGLPLRRLQVGGARLPVYFREVLEHFESLGMSGHEPSEELERVAARHDHRLPTSLRREIVHRLVGELVGRAWALRRSLPPEESNPTAWLDREQPSWRDQLPLVVSDDSAESILRGLMKDVARVASGRGTRIRILTSLRLKVDSAQLLRHLDVPRSVAREDLDHLFSNAPLPPGGRLQVRLRSESGDILRCGVLSRTSDAWSFQPVRGAHFSDEAAAEMITVLAASRTGSVESPSVEGAAPLGPLPWVFRPSPATPEQWDLVACGSARRREPELLVALPPDTTALGNAERCKQTVLGRTLVRVRGDIHIHTDAGLVRVVAGHDSNHSWSHELRGKRFEKVSSSRTAWLGMPSLVRRQGEREEPIDLEVHDHGRWRHASSRDVGELSVRALSDDEVVFRARVRVVPPDLTLRLEVGDKRRPGAIQVSSAALVQAGVPEDPRWQSNVHKNGNSARVELLATGEVPGQLDLTLLFRTGQLNGKVPFPVRSMRFQDPEGTPIERGTKLHIKRLGGIQAIALSPSPRARFAATLRAQITGAGAKPGDRTFHLSERSSGEKSLDLRDVQTAAEELLDATESLDASIDIRLWEVGGSGPSTSIQAKRYDWTLERDQASGDVVLNGPRDGELGDVVVEARPFCDIGAIEQLPRLRSSRLEGNRWVFDPTKRKACSWLVTAREGSWYRCRPVPFSGAGELVELDGLRACFELPRESERHEAIRVALDTMCEDWAHPDWGVVDEYLRLLGDLPAATFDLIRVIAHHQQAAATVALRAAAWDAAELLQVLDGLEELVFLWEAIPFDTWLRAFDTMAASYPPAYADSAGPEITTRMEGIGTEFPSVRVPLFHWLRRRQGAVPPEDNGGFPAAHTFVRGSAAMFLGHRAVELQDFLHRQADAPTWPTPPRSAQLVPTAGLRLSDPSQDPHRQRVIDAPIALAQAAVGQLSLTPAQTLFLEEARSFDETYFRRTFQLTYFGLIARLHGDR